MVEASSRYPWKRELVGREGVVDEVTEKAAAVRFGEQPVWFALACLELMEEKEAV